MMGMGVCGGDRHGGERRSLVGEAVLKVVGVASGRQGRGLGQGRLPGFMWLV